MWTVVYIAHNEQKAGLLREELGREGILASLRPAGMGTRGTWGVVEVLVPESEAEEAQVILSRLLADLEAEKP